MSTQTIDTDQAAVPERGQDERDGVRRGSLRARASSIEVQVGIALVILLVYFGARYPSTFLTDENFLNMGRVAAILLVVSIGQMFALLVGGFDISVAATMGFVSTVVALRLTGDHTIAESIVLGAACGAAVGLVNGVVIAKLGVTPFVATLGMTSFLVGLSNELSGGQSVANLPAGFGDFGANDWGFLPSAVGIGLIVLGVAWVVLARSRAGLFLYAIGGSREATAAAGVRVVRYEILAYTVCGLCAGIAGIVLTSRVTVGQASLGAGYELLSIAAAVIGGVAIGGGIGRLSGVLFGVCLLTVLTTGLDIAGVSQFWQQMITGLVLVGSVLVAQMRGALSGRRALAALGLRRRRAPSAL